VVTRLRNQLTFVRTEMVIGLKTALGFIFLFASLLSLNGQNLYLFDEQSGLPIKGVFVFNDNKTISAYSDEVGIVDLSEFSNEEFSNFQHPYYKTQRTSLLVLSMLKYKMSLSPIPNLADHAKSSLFKWKPEASLIPNKIDAISEDDIAFSDPPTSADMLGSKSAAFIQKNQLSGGSPVLRGYDSKHLLFVIDGVKVNNAISSISNLQNIFQTDVNSIENTIVIYGPGTNFYGSEAFGGVIDFHMLEPKFSKGEKWETSGHGLARITTADFEKTLHADINFGNNKWALLTSISYSDFDDLKMGKIHNNYTQRLEYISRVNNNDSIFHNDNPNVQKFTGFQQLNFISKVKQQFTKTIDWTFSFYFTQTSDVPRYDRLLVKEMNELKYAEWYYEPQQWLMNSLEINFNERTKAFDHASFVAAYQNTKQGLNKRLYKENWLFKHAENVNILSTNIKFDKVLRWDNTIFYGLDFSYNDLVSQGEKENIQTIVKMTSLIMRGTCSIYNRLDKKKDSLVVWSNYNAPVGLDRESSLDGHICYEATIKGKDKTIEISDISKTSYFNSDPTVKKYQLRSYLGHPVKANGEVIGSLCVVDTKVREFTETEKNIISTLSKALSLEHERGILQEKLEASRLEAETANDAKNRFLANMSHEIRTPLNGIMGFTDILINRENDEKKRRMLRMINESGDQLLQIINDIFDYSMIEAGKLSLKESTFDLHEIISDTVAYFKPYALTKGIDLIVDVEGETASNLFGDQYKLTQVLFNLVSNAIKFTEEGTVMILAKNTISATGVELQLVVEDTGIGIDPEKLETIFEEFEQLEYYLTKKTRGTGLGLAIARKLIHFLNGTITVESESGKGSRFIVNLPFRLKKSKNNKEIMNDPEEKPMTKTGNVNILLAEDNEANQFLIKAITKFENWEITVVDNGEQAVNEYKSGNFDLILMDVQMPVMNGYEATRLIREIEETKNIHTPIIALTAYAMKSDKDKCIEAGMDDYISKPFKKQQFLDTIQALLDKNR